jgi:hypothetical protein
LKRDGGIPPSLLAAAAKSGLEVGRQLLDPALEQLAKTNRFPHVASALRRAIPAEMTEAGLASWCVDHLEKKLPQVDLETDEGRLLLEASVELIAHLASMGPEGETLAWRVPLVARDDTVVRPTAQHRMVGPVSGWPAQTQRFSQAYPQGRLLREEYGTMIDGVSVVASLATWGIAFVEPLARIAASELSDDRLKALALDGQDVDGVTVADCEFAQIALLTPEIINRCVGFEEAKALLGLVLADLAVRDRSWRVERDVVGRRDGADVLVRVHDCLWLADLRARAWVPLPTEQGKTNLVMASPETLKPLLDATWLSGNSDARELLRMYFGFDALELQLLGAAPQDETRKDLRDTLAQLIDAAGGNLERLEAVVDDVRARRQREAEVSRCRAFGLAVQAAIQHALEASGLVVEVVDRGFDFEVSAQELLEEGAHRLEIGSYLIEVKATTQDAVRLTAKQAETATSEAHRYVLCVVDMRNVPESRLVEPWTPDEVAPLTRLVSNVGESVQATWMLVDEARSSVVPIRNEAALRFAVPVDIWEGGVLLSDWVSATFGAEVAVRRSG